MKRIAAVLAGAVLVAAVHETAWAAGPPYAVSVGGSSAPGVHAVSASSSGTVGLSFKNSAGTIITMNCSSMSWSGSVASGPAVNPVWSIGSSNWVGCTVPGGSATLTQSGLWSIVGTGSNASASNETIATSLENLALGWATTASPAVCSFTITGSAVGSFNESSQQLVISETGYTGHLSISGVSGCLGQLQNGNKANLVITMNVSSPDGAIHLS